MDEPRASHAGDLVTLLCACLSTGNVDGALRLFEQDAAVESPWPGRTIRGGTAIREALSEIVGMRPTMRAAVTRIIDADGIALLCSDWTFTGTARDGSALNLRGHATDVVRRQADGAWLYLIGNPWGADLPV